MHNVENLFLVNCCFTIWPKRNRIIYRILTSFCYSLIDDLVSFIAFFCEFFFFVFLINLFIMRNCFVREAYIIHQNLSVSDIVKRLKGSLLCYAYIDAICGDLFLLMCLSCLLEIYFYYILCIFCPFVFL